MYCSPTFFALSMSPSWHDFNMNIIAGKPQKISFNYFASSLLDIYKSLTTRHLHRGSFTWSQVAASCCQQCQHAQSKKLEERAYTVCKDQTARRQIAKRRKQEGRRVLFDLQRAGGKREGEAMHNEHCTLIVWPSGAPIATDVQHVPTLAPFPTIFKLFLLSYSNYFYYSIISKQRTLIYTVPYSATQYRYVIIALSSTPSI